jgi:hypothetical protein
MDYDHGIGVLGTLPILPFKNKKNKKSFFNGFQRVRFCKNNPKRPDNHNPHGFTIHHPILRHICPPFAVESHCVTFKKEFIRQPAKELMTTSTKKFVTDPLERISCFLP